MKKLTISDKTIESLLDQDNPYHTENHVEISKYKWFDWYEPKLKDYNGNVLIFKRCNQAKI